MATAGAEIIPARVARALLLVSALLLPQAVCAADNDLPQRGLWQSLIVQSRELGLPTQFLQRIPADFARFEFEDLHAFAAEYHPGERRLILNRTLSFNAAAGTLRPLKTLSARDLGTLFHELMHVYLDYLASLPDPAASGEAGSRLLAFARSQQQCRYQVVAITPFLQRKTRTETRVLTEHESWEALHEAWAVFVGWAIWTQRELNMKASGDAVPEAWIRRIKKADQQGEWAGYYEPEEPAERAVTRKRFLAHTNRLTPGEASMILRFVLDYSDVRSKKAAAAMEQNRPPVAGNPPCPSASE
jgi:hypothetical protein